MSELLDAVRDELRNREQRREELAAELAGVDRDLEQLTAISELAESLNGNGAVGTAPEPVEPSRGRAKGAGTPAPASGNGGNAPARRSSGPAGSAPSGATKRAPSSTTGPGIKRAAVLAYIAEHGPVTGAGAIADALGISHGAMHQHLRKLVDAGEIQANGPKSARVYSTTTAADQASSGRGHAKGTGARVPLPQLKQRVTDAIARDPGQLTEERLALALDVDREDVAVTTGELLEAGDVLLQPDGTYTIDRGGVPEPVNTTTEQTKAVGEVLGRIDSAMHAKEIAYQATKAGTPVSEREASTILLALEQDGRAVRFSGIAGRLAWRAAE